MQAVFRCIWSPNMHPSENRGLRAGRMRYFWERVISGRKFISSAECILGEPGATSRNDAIFLGERHFARKYLLPKNIASFRLAPPWSPRMTNMGSHFSRCSWQSPRNLEMRIALRAYQGRKTSVDSVFYEESFEKLWKKCFICSSQTQTHTLFVGNPHQNITSDFETGRSTNSIAWKRWKRWKKWIPQI